MPDLTKDEYNALISMPKFQKALKKAKEARAEDERRKHEERTRDLCEGAAPIAEGLILRCPKCGLTLEHEDTTGNLYRNHLVLMRGRHWNRPDRPNANPFTSNGMYGKAAGGDWYMDH